MARFRGEITVGLLLKVVLGLVIVWLFLEILETVLDITFGLLEGLLGPLRPIVALLIVVFVILWLLDRQ